MKKEPFNCFYISLLPDRLKIHVYLFQNNVNNNNDKTAVSNLFPLEGRDPSFSAVFCVYEKSPTFETILCINNYDILIKYPVKS